MQFPQTLTGQLHPYFYLGMEGIADPLVFAGLVKEGDITHSRRMRSHFDGMIDSSTQRSARKVLRVQRLLGSFGRPYRI